MVILIVIISIGAKYYVLINLLRSFKCRRYTVSGRQMHDTSAIVNKKKLLNTLVLDDFKNVIIISVNVNDYVNSFIKINFFTRFTLIYSMCHINYQ